MQACCYESASKPRLSAGAEVSGQSGVAPGRSDARTESGKYRVGPGKAAPGRSDGKERESDAA